MFLIFLEPFIALLIFFAHFYISTIILVKSHNAVQINDKSKQKRSWKDHNLILIIVCVSNRKFLHWALILKSLYVILKKSQFSFLKWWYKLFSLGLPSTKTLNTFKKSFSNIQTGFRTS